MIVISFVNMKGGVAKTTLAVNVADCLARRHGARVLLIDIDPQFNATQCLVSPTDYAEALKQGSHTILHVFDDARAVAGAVGGFAIHEPVKLDEIEPWEVQPGLDLLPGNLELHRLDMGSGQGREHRLQRFVEQLRAEGRYDYVIIDTPPTPSAWMASALIASDYYLVPVKPEPLSATGIDLLNAVVARVKENYGLKLECAAVVLTIAEQNTVVFRQAVEFLTDNQVWSGKLLRNVLPKRTAVARMQGKQQLILDSDDTELLRSLTSITQEIRTRVDGDE